MGICPEVSLKLARQRRDNARKLLARDIDPSAYRKAQKRSRSQWDRNSFEAVASEWLAKHSPVVRSGARSGRWTSRRMRMTITDLQAPASTRQSESPARPGCSAGVGPTTGRRSCPSGACSDGQARRERMAPFTSVGDLGSER